MEMNNTINNTDFVSDYDHNGAIIYTIVTLLFYSLSLFCSLILNIDPDDHYYEKKWLVYQHSQHKKTLNSNQTDILNILSDQTLRRKYWQIYYGNDDFESRSNKFLSQELKRLSIVTQRMKELNNEQIKQTSKHQEFYELNQIITNNNIQQPSPDPSTSSLFLFKFRRSRSTSIPGVSYSDNSTVHRSYNILCQTPLCKPPTMTFTKD